MTLSEVTVIISVILSAEDLWKAKGLLYTHADWDLKFSENSLSAFSFYHQKVITSFNFLSQMENYIAQISKARPARADMSSVFTRTNPDKSKA